MKKSFFAILIATLIVTNVTVTSCNKEDTKEQCEKLEQNGYSLTVCGSKNGTASITSVETFSWSDWVTLTATANKGYRFVEWQIIKDGILVSTNTDNPVEFGIGMSYDYDATAWKAMFVSSVGLPESITVNVKESYDEREYESKYKYVYKYDIQNRIVECVQYIYISYYENWYRNSISTMDYNAVGELVEYYEPGSPSARSTRSTFSKNSNKINFTISYHPTVPIFGDVNGELELNTQGLPVKMTYEGTEMSVTTGSNSWNYTTVKLTWQNGNITKTDWERDWKRENVILNWENGEIDRVEREEGLSSGTTTYTYDDKKTPFYRLNASKWFLWWLNYDWSYVDRMNLVGNENNVKTETREDGSTTTYEYTYNSDGFPITRSWESAIRNGTITETYTYY